MLQLCDSPFWLGFLSRNAQNELRKVDRRAFWLFVPCGSLYMLLVPPVDECVDCAWLGWATYLNAGVWHLNRSPASSAKSTPPDKKEL